MNLKRQLWISILLHSGLNPARHFWLSTRFSCCLKMKSVENILGYVWEQFYRFSRGCKPRENLWNCSRKYTEMFKTDSFLDNKKLSFNQNVWRDHATMQQDVLLHFWMVFLYWNQSEILKKYSVVQHCFLSALQLFHYLPIRKTVRLHGNKLQDATNDFLSKSTLFRTLYFRLKMIEWLIYWHISLRMESKWKNTLWE